MKNIESKENIILISLLLIALSVFLYYRWNDNKSIEYKGAYKELSSTYNKLKESVKKDSIIKKRERDSLISIINLREVSFVIKENNNSEIKKNIDIIKNKKIEIPEKIVEMTDYYNQRYNTKENSSLENSVLLGKNTSMKIITDLEYKDKLTQIDSLRELQINNKDNQISLLQQDKKDLNTVIKSLDEIIEQKTILQSSANRNIENLNKQVKVLRRTNTINKILVPAAAVLGGYIGYKIIK